MDIEKKDDEIYKRDELNQMINSISEDIILDNIISQINTHLDDNTIENKVSLFGYFEDRYDYLYNLYKDDTTILSRIYFEFDKVLNAIMDSLQKLMKFKITFDPGIDFNIKILLVKSLYEFFIIYFKDGLESLLFNAINKNINTLKKICKIKNKKDLAYLEIKKVINNDYTEVVYNINNIINDMTIDCNDDAIDYMTLDDPETVYNYYTHEIFFENYFSDIIFEDNLYDIIKDKIINDYALQLKVKQRLIEKYKKF